MSIDSTVVFLRWEKPCPLESAFDRLSRFCERMGLGWVDPGSSAEVQTPPSARIVLRAKRLVSRDADYVRLWSPIDWRFARENQTIWRIEWRLMAKDPCVEFRFFVDNYPEHFLVPRNGSSGEVFWIGVSVWGALRFGRRESDEDTRRLKEKYDAFKILFQTLECDEAVAAGYYDDAPPEDHRYRYFRLGKTGIQILTERFEPEEIRALATGSYDGKLLLPPETLPQILDSVC